MQMRLITGLLSLCFIFLPNGAQNLTWPSGQALPRFAEYGSLDMLDISGLDFDRKVALTCLQGIVNRKGPKIYLLDAQQSGEGKNFWADKLTVTKTIVSNPLSLFTKYRSELAGICIYDPKVPGTINVSVTAAGITNCAVASPTLAQTLMAPPYSLPSILDLRTLAFASDRAAFTWAKNEYWSRCTHRILAGMKPGVHYPLMDYIVANRAMCIWLAPEQIEDRPLLDALFADMPVNGVYTGWWAGETSGVGYASGFGVMTLATDWFSNATVHGGGSAALTNLPEVASPPNLANKCYIAPIMSDGDNLQEQEHLFPIRWKSNLRGTFPVSWTQSPALADFAPAMLNYFYATRTPNDCFITGPSGVGYVLPEKMTANHFREFSILSASYLKKTGIRTATIWGNANWASDAFGIHSPELLGLANKQGGAAPMGTKYWNGGLPSLEMAPDYASFGTQIMDEINLRMKSWNRTRPMFIAPQLNSNVAGLDEFQIVYDAYKNNPDIVFVRADQLFQLMRAANPNPVVLQNKARDGFRQKQEIKSTTSIWTISASRIPKDLRGRQLRKMGL